MKRRVALVLLLAPALAAPASAGIFFNKKADKPDPAQRVPDLIKALQTDGDEDKRMAAAAELRDYDVGQFPDIVPALIDALLNDKKAGVRAEAAQSLGKIRPVSDQVGMALEQSLSKDASPRVRLQDRSALLQYRWNGWKEPAKKDEGPTARPKEPPPVQTKEPPLAPPPAPNIPPPPGKLNPQAEPMPNLAPVPSAPAPPPASQDRGPDLGPPPG
jgi:HEAT repeat protein